MCHAPSYTNLGIQNALSCSVPERPKNRSFLLTLFAYSYRSRESVRKAADIVNQFSLIAEILDEGTVHLYFTLRTLRDIFVATEVCKAPILRDNDLLATRKLSQISRRLGIQWLVHPYLILGSSKSFDSSGTVDVPRANRENDLANVHARDGAVRLAKCTTHPRLQPIGTSA